MAKNKKKRSPAIVRSELLLKGMDNPILVIESYSTVKKRLHDIHLFFEITDSKRVKSTWPKDMVAGLLPRV